jgi:4-amino-4-deoxy-L-arabinose transferase-like glycosyltransferase
MACTATVALALVIFDRWLTAPSAARAAALGFAIGLGMLSKFSFIVFFGSGAIVLLLLRRPRVIALLRAIAIAALIAMLLVWAGYRFSVGKFADTNRFGKEMAAASVPAPLSEASVWIATNVPIPAPAFFAGVASVRGHNAAGHLAYLLGRYSTHGWWYYFPVVLFFKTPIPFWIFVAWGTAALIRERNREGVVLIVIAAAMMLAVMPSSINIGVRHVLPVYAPLAIIAAYGIVSIARSTRDAFGRAMLAALLLWLFVGVAAIHPDYLAWFNEFAGPNPERIASDSNLDWGQDVLRLRNAARRLHVDVLHAAIISTVMLDHHGVTAVDLAPFQHTAGWVALSESALVVPGQHGEYRWLNLYRPVRRVGKTIRLYYIP